MKFKIPLIKLLSFSIEFSTGHHANTSHTFVVLNIDDFIHLPVGKPKISSMLKEKLYKSGISPFNRQLQI